MDRALELDQNLGQAYVSRGTLGVFYTFEWSSSDRDFKRALELSPEYPDLYHFYGHYLEALGRTNEAIATFQQGLARDPYSPVMNTELAWCYYKSRQYTMAKDQCQKVIQIHPDFLWVYQVPAFVLIQQKEYEAALGVLVQARGLESGYGQLTAALEGSALGLRGDKAQARVKFAELKAMAEKSGVLVHYCVAMIHLALGEEEDALTSLEHALKTGSLFMSFIGVEPLFEPLYSDERFKQLLKDMRLSR